MQHIDELLKKALMLTPKEKITIIEALIKSLDAPDSSIDPLWKQECESRLEAFEKGGLEAISIQEAFARYNLNAD